MQVRIAGAPPIAWISQFSDKCSVLCTKYKQTKYKFFCQNQSNRHNSWRIADWYRPRHVLFPGSSILFNPRALPAIGSPYQQGSYVTSASEVSLIQTGVQDKSVIFFWFHFLRLGNHRRENECHPGDTFIKVKIDFDYNREWFCNLGALKLGDNPIKTQGSSCW